MKSYTNYLYYNYCHCIDNFTKIIDDLIKGELLPKDMDEETHNKMNEWFGPDWSYIFGYKTCDKNYSKPKLTQSDPIYKFVISFPTDEEAYESFVEEARSFLINTIVKLFSRDQMRLSVYGDITQYGFNISDYFEVFQRNLNEPSINSLYSQEDFLHIQYLYANELFFAKQFEKALKEYDKYFKQVGLINTDNYNEEFLRNLTRCYSRVGFIYEKLNNYHSAFIYKGLAVGAWPCRETYLSLCVIHFQVGNILEAQRYFELGLSCNQSDSYEIMSNYWNPVWLDQLKTTINNQLKGV